MLFLSEKESDSVSNPQASIVSSISEKLCPEKVSLKESSKQSAPQTANRNSRNQPTETPYEKSLNLIESISSFYDANKTRSNAASFLSAYTQSLCELCLVLNGVFSHIV
jgi:hypothetical protein